MVMTPKKIAVVIALVVATIPTVLVLRGRRAPAPTPLTQEQVQAQNDAAAAAALQQQRQQVVQQIPIAAVPEPAAGEAELRAFVSAFVEQFGSYSNESSFSNITALKPQMTASFAAWADTYAADQRKKYPSNGPYYGVTTRVLNVVVRTSTEDADLKFATVRTQRETTAGTAKTITYPTMELTLMRNGAIWQVDNATWK